MKEILISIGLPIVISTLIAYAVSVRIRMFDIRLKCYEEVREIIKALLQNYHRVWKLSFVSRSESNQNTIKYFMDNSIEEAAYAVHLKIEDRAFNLDFIHKQIIWNNFNKITKIMEADNSVLPNSPEIDKARAIELDKLYRKIKVWF
jgi:hypothetical protein